MKCQVCGREFEPHRRDQKYCSKKCRNKYRNVKHEVKKCECCGREYVARAANQRFCSERCRFLGPAQSTSRIKPPKEYIPPFAWKPARRACLKCGKEFEEHFKGDKFCSDECCLQYYRPQVKASFVNVFRDIMGKGRLKW